MKGCESFQENLSRYIDGELDESIRNNMENHQRECPLCQLLLTEERKWDELINQHQVK